MIYFFSVSSCKWFVKGHDPSLIRSEIYLLLTRIPELTHSWLWIEESLFLTPVCRSKISRWPECQKMPESQWFVKTFLGLTFEFWKTFFFRVLTLTRNGDLDKSLLLFVWQRKILLHGEPSSSEHLSWIYQKDRSFCDNVWHLLEGYCGLDWTHLLIALLYRIRTIIFY